jgi:hypothetical protein
MMTVTERIEELEKALKACVDAMDKSLRDGSTDHLDCADDGGAFWYDAAEKARQMLK